MYLNRIKIFLEAIGGIMILNFTRTDGAVIELLTGPKCKWCGKRVPEPYDICNNCYTEWHPSLKIHPAGEYLLDGGWTESQLSKDIWSLKNGNRQIANGIGECLVYVIDVLYPYLKNLDIIVPVPSGTLSRGYNQASLLSQFVSNNIGLPLHEILYVAIPYPPQHETNWRLKRENIEGKIGCSERIDEMGVLLIDDTCITGSTMDECANVLRSFGASDVQGLVAAKSIDITHRNFLENMGR
jgi:predicted amidophosphoribosyltransferase